MKFSLNVRLSFLLFFYCINVVGQQKPNIVFILTDDQRFQGTIHALGGNEVITPNIDALAKSGTSFLNAYIMGGSQAAVCTPSRNMIMTGRNLFSIGGEGGVILPANTTLGETLNKNGYHTYGIGKWHNDKASFNRTFSGGDNIFFGGMGDQYSHPLNTYDISGLYNVNNNTTDNHGKHSSEIFAEAAVNFISHADKEKPFFLYVAFTAPHDPRVMPDKYKEMYDTAKISLPVNFMPQHPFDNGELTIRDEKLAGFPRTSQEIKLHIRDYYAMMTHMDEQIGKIIQTLKEHGKYENTIIVFAGDNGLALGQHGLMGKQNVYEHSIKVPLIFAGKNIPKGKRTTDFVYTMDIFPTLCKLINIDIPASVQGQVILGSNIRKRESLFFAYKNFQRSVRKGDLKMIKYNVNGKETVQLFNLRKDPSEINNLSSDPKFSSKLHEMNTELIKQKQINSVKE